MQPCRVRELSILLAVLSLSSALAGLAPRVRADPSITNNADGTSTAVWDFTTPADYARANTAISGGTVSLASQTTWWNSTAAGDFAAPDSETNIDRTTLPGDVALGSASGPQTLLALQPGATGEDSWLDRNNAGLNHGADTTMVLDGRNPQKRPILRFDLSAVPAGSVIDDATLSLYESAGFGNPYTASVYQVTAAWNEMQVTWSDRVTGTAWAGAGGDFSGHVVGQVALDNTAGWRAWNVTQLVDLWYRGRLPNYGLILNAPSTGAPSDKTFYSSDYGGNPTLRPKLDIRYRILGATGTYVSQVGGPGTAALWQSISWNATERSLASDAFSGATLDSKWAWTNPPAAYDVGTTTPGSLHVVSSTAVDFTGATFTGNVLGNDVVGDFTATMKFNADPTVSGQKSGLIVLLSPRDWYAAWKMNVGGGIRNWRISATADAITTARVNVNSGNPVPAWIRIQRAGNVFSTSTSTDGTTWTARDAYTPGFEYPLSVRLALAFADGASGTALATDVDYLLVTFGNDATVSVSTRTGDVTPVDGTWSSFTAPHATPSGSPLAGSSRYIEYRLSFAVTYPDHLPVVGDVNISWIRYQASGTIETNDLVPTDLAGWGSLTTVHALNGQTIAYERSLDSGGSWTPVAPPADLSALSIATGKIRFRASLSTSNTLVTPTLSEVRLSYTHTLDHFHVTASGSVAAGASFTVTVTAKDALNATITGWTGTVALAARLLDGVTPGGGILGTTSVVIATGGTATLATETYTKAETIRINASAATATGLSGPTVVSTGPIVRMDLSPPNATLTPFDTQAFAGAAYDVYDNVAAGVSFNWTVGGGVGTLNTTAGPSVLFTASPPPANGTLQASFGAIQATAPISVVSGVPPWILFSAPGPGAHITGIVPIAYTTSADAVSLRFEYDDGSGWTLIGSTAVLNGTYFWDTSPLDFVNGRYRAIVTNNKTITNTTIVSPIEVDNTPPTIALGAITDDQAGTGTISIAYGTDADVVRVDFTYFDGAWKVAGTDVTVDGSFLWTPGSPINGVVLRAVATDEVNLSGADQRQGVGTYVTGSNPPAIAAIPDIHVRLGVAYVLNLTFYVSDPDTPRAALTVTDSDAANVTANAGAYPSLSIIYGVPGTYTVTLWVSDGTDTAWRNFRIIAAAQNPPALVAALPPVTFDEDAVAANAFGAPATAFFNDLDGDPLAFTVLDGIRVLSQVNGNDTIDLWALPNWFGSETLRIRATDPSGGFAESAFPVTVLAVDDAPVLVSAFPAVAFDEDTTLLDGFGGNATAHFSDVDGDPLTLTVQGLLVLSARVNGDGTIDLWAPANWSGSEALRVRATDPSGGFAEGAFLVTVRPVNDGPVVASPIAAATFDEDTTDVNAIGGPLAPHFADIDGDSLTYTILGAAAVQYRINANGTVDLWAAGNWSGSESLTVRGTDPNGSFADTPLSVTVLPVNDAPVLAAIAALTMTEGEIRTLNLTPYVSDVDNPVSSLLVTTDSPYVRASGLVLTLQFPGNYSQARFTVFVSDGSAGASRALRVTIVPPVWKLVALPVVPFSVAVVIGVFVQRQRWRPVKAFLVDERKQMLREFTLDPSCDVTFDQVREAGALDAVEKAVKVARYHAQTVRGDALAVTLLAYGPVTPAQVDFAREMLVNVQLKFDDHVKERLAEARAVEGSVAASKESLVADRDALDAKAKAFTEMYDAVLAGQARIAEQGRDVRAALEDLGQREGALQAARDAADVKARDLAALTEALDSRSVEVQARESRAAELAATLDGQQIKIEELRANLPEREAAVLDREGRVQATERDAAVLREAVTEERGMLEAAQAKFEADRSQLSLARQALESERRESEARMGKAMEDLRLRSEGMDSHARSLQESHVKLTEAREAFEAMREQKTSWIANKDIELEAKEHTLREKEEAIRAHAEANARQLSDLAAREEAEEIEGDRLERLTAELDARKHDLDVAAKAHESKGAELRELEAHKGEEFRSWESSMESQQRLLKGEAEAFEKETGEARVALAARQSAVEARESELADREAKARASVESAMRIEDEGKARESSAAEALAAAKDLKSHVDEERTALASRAAELEGREHTLKEDVRRRSEALAASTDALKAEQAAFEARRVESEREVADRLVNVKVLEEDLGNKIDSMERRAMSLIEREEVAVSTREALERERADVGAIARQHEARQLELTQMAQRTEEEATRLRTETDALRQSFAAKEADLGAERERLERESRSLQDTLGAKAEELARREKALAATEANSAAEVQALDTRAREIEARDRDTSARAEEIRNLAATVTARQAAVESRAAQLEESSRKLAEEQDAKHREWESLQEVFKTQETRSRTEVEGRLAQIAAKAAELEKREREVTGSTSKLEEQRLRIEEKSRALDAREAQAATAWTQVERRTAELRDLEATVTQSRNAFETERTAWAPRYAEEMKRLEAAQHGAVEQQQKAEKLLEDAQRRTTIAEGAEQASKRKLEELSAKRLQLDARLGEAEKAERSIEAQAAQIQEASRKLAGRELEIATITKDVETRRAQLDARAKETEAAVEDLRVRRSTLDQDAAHLEKLDASLRSQRAAAETATTEAEARLMDVVERENLAKKREGELAVREKALPAIEKDLAAREAAVSEKEASLKSRLSEVDRMRLEVESMTAKADEDRRATAAAREEAKGVREKAESMKVQADAQQAEVSKHMKFLQKKAVETLDREDLIRKREAQLAERDRILESKFEIVEGKEKHLEAEREETAAKLARAEAEVSRLKSQAADLEKGGAASAEVEDRSRDLENRLKIIQRKAMELLDREEKVRLREEELKARG
ncbi:MAG TPA: DNRLRE domain-containing protein [Thermoplasmata archaeon]|nr:DNRLRE domain-containing protein [Thermoplasmata archaeon]